jgi:hypothetical protein
LKKFEWTSLIVALDSGKEIEPSFEPHGRWHPRAKPSGYRNSPVMPILKHGFFEETQAI